MRYIVDKNNQDMTPILFHRIWKKVVLVTAVIMVKLLLKSYIVGQTAIIIIMGCIYGGDLFLVSEPYQKRTRGTKYIHRKCSGSTGEFLVQYFCTL